MNTPSTSDERCPSPAIHEAIAAYSFGDLDLPKREQVALHLVECDLCWHEVQQLEASVRALRHDPALRPIEPSAELFSVLGLSGRLVMRFGGHLPFALSVASVYGLLFAEALLTELSYFIDRYSVLAMRVVPLAMVWMGLTTIAALAIGVRLARTGRRTAVLWSVVILLASAAVLLVVEHVVLPHEPSIAATFQPRTVAGANLRNTVLYGLPLGILFVLVPFHFVVAIQRELSQGRGENVLRLLSKDPLALTPRGAIYVPPLILGGLLVASAVYLIVANQYLLDNLASGPHSELFTTLIYLRIGLGLGLAASCLAWYVRNLDEAKREPLAVRRLTDSTR